MKYNLLRSHYVRVPAFSNSCQLLENKLNLSVANHEVNKAKLIDVLLVAVQFLSYYILFDILESLIIFRPFMVVVVCLTLFFLSTLLLDVWLIAALNEWKAN